MNPVEKKTALDFQSIMFTLQTYWAKQGALIWQPYYSQVGAGTMNPATYLRVLGPEPWKVAYVEPSVRPDDGRYGINPNRLQQHYQFQVILKPDPGNPQELYLDSLRALGIDPNQHDIRFVEDNWESPALSAWGLGWEVWLDGQEITQFTYFQQAGGVVLEVPAVEITYGLERIAMALQKVRDFKQIQWSPLRSYGDVNQVAEREHSTYYFEVADVPRLREVFTLFEQEANLALEAGLVLPAYDYVIKCSHTFNVLDSRGAVGYTDRQALFGKMRELSRRVAEAYLAQREEMGFPWQEGVQPPLVLEAEPVPAASDAATADFMLEVGTEELPTADLEAALQQLQDGVDALLSKSRLSHGEVFVVGTPRRLVVFVENLETQQARRVIEVKGPPADRAFDVEGKPTRVAEGFARSRGLELSQLQVKNVDGGDYVVVEVEEEGRPAIEMLAVAVPEMLKAIRFTKAMRWNETGGSFSRPVRWLVALLGENIIPFEFAGLQTGRITRGLRFSETPELSLKSPCPYPPYMESQGIILDPQQRKKTVWKLATELAEKTGGKLAEDAELLTEVSNLVERPSALLGTFDKKYLEALPPEVLIGVMKKHQRYFPVLDQEGNLSQYFIIIRNGSTEHGEVVVDGNLQVIHARFADAEFFIREDKEKAFEDFVPKLAQLTFQKELGSMLDKTTRIQALVKRIGSCFGLSAAEQSAADRTALLCKADLATAMVVEMTALQGVMGRFYARLSGEPEAVARGIYEHYLPRNSEDKLPEEMAGTLVGIADRLDSIAGLFAVGLAPTGNKDPFALRRTALGLAQLLIGKDFNLNLACALDRAGEQLPCAFSPEAKAQALEFISGRLKSWLLDQGLRFDVVDAVLRSQADNPAASWRNAQVLTAWIAKPEWAEILPAYSRCMRITRGLTETYAVEPDLLLEPQEQGLYRAVDALAVQLKKTQNIELAMRGLAGLVEPINTFFDAILVMAEDGQVRENRLGLLQKIVALMQPYADFSALEGF